jgi:hypothetical protein
LIFEEFALLIFCMPSKHSIHLTSKAKIRWQKNIVLVFNHISACIKELKSGGVQRMA